MDEQTVDWNSPVMRRNGEPVRNPAIYTNESGQKMVSFIAADINAHEYSDTVPFSGLYRGPENPCLADIINVSPEPDKTIPDEIYIRNGGTFQLRTCRIRSRDGRGIPMALDLLDSASDLDTAAEHNQDMLLIYVHSSMVMPNPKRLPKLKDVQ